MADPQHPPPPGPAVDRVFVQSLRGAPTDLPGTTRATDETGAEAIGGLEPAADAASSHAGPRIDRITDDLWTGGDLPGPLDDAIETLRSWEAHGIRHIFDTRREWTDERFVEVLAPAIRYVHSGVDDAGQRIPDWWFDEVVTFAHEARDLGGSVLIHCHMGINRGPSAAYAVLLADGWDPIDAIEQIRSARPVAAVGYAEDALRWRQHRDGTSARKSKREQRELARWRADNPHDTVRIVRAAREGTGTELLGHERAG